MISALRRDGLVLSSSAARCQTRASKTVHQRHLLRQTAVVCSTQHTQPVAYARHFSWTAHRLASLPPPPEKLTGSDHAPPPIVPQRKAKVELKPGPVKPKVPSPEISSAPTVNAPDNAPSQTNAPTPSSSSMSHTDTHEGIIEGAKHDMEAAAKHGILAPPPEGSSRLYQLYHQAKELFKFYLRGLKLIFTNSKRAKEMEERVRSGGPALTRWETKFIQTCKDDKLKLIPFAMIIIIAEEVIPLVVLYAPFILPSTCILPSQRDRIDAKKREKQRLFVTSHAETFIQLADNAAAGATVQSSLAGIPLKPLSGLLGLSTYAPGFLQLRSLRRHLKTIREDDALLSHESNGTHLTPFELRRALLERGMLTDELAEDQWKPRLEWWLRSVKESSEESAADPAAVRLRLIAQSALGRF